VGVQRYAAAALPPGMTRYPLYMRVGGPRVGLDERNCHTFLEKCC